MAFTSPNLSQVPTMPYLARFFSVDIDILVAGLGRTGVGSGCAVTAQASPNMTVAVAAGVIHASGGLGVSVAAGNVTVTTAHATNPRIDLVVANLSSGAKAVTAGTAAITPEPPAIPASSVVLAFVGVPAADTAINAAQIIDKRALINVPVLPSAFDAIVRKTLDETVSNATLQPDNELLFTGLGSGTYVLEGFFSYSRTSGSSGLLRVGWSTTDASATLEWTPGQLGSAAAMADKNSTQDLQTSAGASSGGTVWGRLILTTTATLQMRWCSTNTDPVTVRKGSMLRLTKVV